MQVSRQMNAQNYRMNDMMEDLINLMIGSSSAFKEKNRLPASLNSYLKELNKNINKK